MRPARRGLSSQAVPAKGDHPTAGRWHTCLRRSLPAGLAAREARAAACGAASVAGQQCQGPSRDARRRALSRHELSCTAAARGSGQQAGWGLPGRVRVSARARRVH